MALAQATRDKLISVGTARIAAALAKHGLRRQSLTEHGRPMPRR